MERLQALGQGPGQHPGGPPVPGAGAVRPGGKCMCQGRIRPGHHQQLRPQPPQRRLLREAWVWVGPRGAEGVQHRHDGVAGHAAQGRPHTQLPLVPLLLAEHLDSHPAVVAPRRQRGVVAEVQPRVRGACCRDSRQGEAPKQPAACQHGRPARLAGHLQCAEPWPRRRQGLWLQGVRQGGMGICGSSQHRRRHRERGQLVDAAGGEVREGHQRGDEVLHVTRCHISVGGEPGGQRAKAAHQQRCPLRVRLQQRSHHLSVGASLGGSVERQGAARVGDESRIGAKRQQVLHNAHRRAAGGRQVQRRRPVAVALSHGGAASAGGSERGDRVQTGVRASTGGMQGRAPRVVSDTAACGVRLKQEAQGGGRAGGAAACAGVEEDLAGCVRRGDCLLVVAQDQTQHLRRSPTGARDMQRQRPVCVSHAGSLERCSEGGV